MNTPDPHQPLSPPPVPPGWERFQVPTMMVPQTAASAIVVPEPQSVQKPQPTWRRFWRQVGGGSLTLSIGVHVALLLLAGAVYVGSQVMEDKDGFISAGRKSGEEARKDLEHRIKHNAVKILKKPSGRLVVPIDNDTNLPEPAPLELAVSTQGTGSMGTGLSASALGNGMSGLSGNGPSTWLPNMPKMMVARCASASRMEKLRQNGGTPECEMAVSKSLEWLRGQQSADGSWGRANKAAMTALSLLCFLGRCETPDSAFYGDQVRNGMLYLIEVSRKNEHGILSETPMANQATYEHGIATYALGEMHAFYRLGGSSLPGLRETFEKGVRLIIEQQNELGAWTYGGKEAGKAHAYNKDSRGEDLSVTGWQFQALKAAKHSGLKFAGLDLAISRCCDYLETKQTKDGGFGKTNRDEHYNQWSLTGCGVLGLQTLATNKTAIVKKGIRFMREFLTAEPLDWDRNCNLYCWYYYTQAFFQQGGEDWKFYNAQFMPQVLGAQQADGSFKRGRPNWPAGDAADAIYRQCLCTLQLEVYYRYLKVADREAESVFDR